MKYNKKLLLISLWYGDLPKHFNFWINMVSSHDYDVLIVTDQELNSDLLPNNVIYHYLSLENLNILISEYFNVAINIKYSYKLVDLKPAFGVLFKTITDKYEYWGYSDIDMLMGNILQFILRHSNYEVYSFGFKTFGPMMIFKTSISEDLIKIDNYVDILNDDLICKVDEMWFWDSHPGKEILHASKLYDQTRHSHDFRFYNGRNLLDIVSDKKTFIFRWNPGKYARRDLDWDIKKLITKNNKWRLTDTYIINGKNLKKNGRNITLVHLYLLKNNNNFLSLMNKNIGKTFYKFSITYTSKYHNEDLTNLNIYEIYDKYIDVEIKQL